MKFQFLILSLFLPFSLHSFSPLHSCYEKLFGDKPVSTHYELMMRKALRDFGVSAEQQIPIRKMNDRPENWIGHDLYSFTLTGIWINEEALSECTPAEQEFIMYHEAAHYTSSHHAKVGVVMAVALGFNVAVSSIVQQKFEQKFSTGVAFTGLLYASYELILKRIIKEQEQAADLAAARMLCHKGKAEVVQEHLNSLLELINQGYGADTDGWHYTITEQFASMFWYLQSVGITCVLEHVEDLPT